MKFEDVKSLVSCIYRLRFPDGKFYVGQTKDLRGRIRLYERCIGDVSHDERVICALRACGIENVDIDILCEPSGLSGDDLSLCLSILEIKYIKENDCIYPKGYNTSIGGELLGIPVDVIRTKFGVDSEGYANKSILAYDVEGNFVAEYESIKRCAYELGVEEKRIRDVLGKMKLFRNMYMLREKKYGDVPQKIPPFKPEVVVRRRQKTVYDVVVEKVYKKKVIDNGVVMYDKEGNYVGLFDNVRKSRLFLKMDDTKLPFGREFRGVYIFHYNGGEIKKSLGAFTSKTLTTMDYDDILALGDVENIGERISLKLEPLPVKEEEGKASKVGRMGKEKPRIVQYTLDGEYVRTYDSTSHAAADNNVYASAILACAKKITRRCGNFIYRFEGDELDLPKFSPITLKQRMPIEKNLFE